MRLLLDSYPDGAKAMNERGSLPLHHAAYRDAPMEVARLLLDAHPAGTKATTTVSYIVLTPTLTLTLTLPLALA